MIKLGKSSNYRAFVITKINDKKDKTLAPLLGLLIPEIDTNKVIYLKNKREIKYEWSKYMCEKMEYYKCDGNNCKLFDEEIKNAQNWTLTIEGLEKKM